MLLKFLQGAERNIYVCTYSRNVVANFSNKFQLVRTKSNERKVDFTDSLSNVGSNLTSNHFDFLRARAHTRVRARTHTHTYAGYERTVTYLNTHDVYSSEALPNAQSKTKTSFWASRAILTTSLRPP